MKLILFLMFYQISSEIQEEETWNTCFKGIQHDITARSRQKIKISNKNHHIFRCNFIRLKSSVIDAQNINNIMISHSEFSLCSQGTTIDVNAVANMTVTGCCFTNSTSNNEDNYGIALAISKMLDIEETIGFRLEKSILTTCGYITDFKNSALIFLKEFPKIATNFVNITNNKCLESPAFDLNTRNTQIQYTQIENNTALQNQIIKHIFLKKYNQFEPDNAFYYCNFIYNTCENGYLFNTNHQFNTNYCAFIENNCKFQSSRSIIVKNNEYTQASTILMPSLSNCYKEVEKTEEMTNHIQNIYKISRRNQYSIE